MSNRGEFHKDVMEEEDRYQIYNAQLHSEEKKFMQGTMPQYYSLVRKSKIDSIIEANRNLMPEGGEVVQTARGKYKKPSGTFESSFGKAKTTKELSEMYKKCESIINLLIAHPFADQFTQPVNYQALQLYDYPSIVNEAVDFASIKLKLEAKKYPNLGEFVAEVRKVFSNSFLYYPRHSAMYLSTVTMSEYFESLNHEFLNPTQSTEELLNLNSRMKKLANKVKSYGNTRGLHLKPMNERPMTLEEKKELCYFIKGTYG